jgi:NADH:ubiquinone oxidoreductase subunit 6 (subunit J)
MPGRYSEAQVALETVILTLLGLSAVSVMVLAGLMMRDMGVSQRSQGGAYYVEFFALFVLGAIFSKFVTVMVRRRDRRPRTEE